ncbi:1603_t:CDS:1, partial [Acaulospora morrowiae]
MIIDASDADMQREFANWLLKLGEGCIPEVTYNNGYISLPSDIVLKCNTYQGLIDFVYPNLHAQAQDMTYLIERGILASRNNEVDMLNAEVLARFPGEEITYYSEDTLDQNSETYDPAQEDLYS